jgi:hypothetical protein
MRLIDVLVDKKSKSQDKQTDVPNGTFQKNRFGDLGWLADNHSVESWNLWSSSILNKGLL